MTVKFNYKISEQPVGTEAMVIRDEYPDTPVAGRRDVVLKFTSGDSKDHVELIERQYLRKITKP